MKRKLILQNYQGAGDIVVLTGTVRDLHACNPGMFETDVRTSCPELWDNNPHITPVNPRDPLAERIRCEQPLSFVSNTLPYHMVHGFTRDLAEKLNVRVEPTAFKGDIYLSDEEQNRLNEVEKETGLSNGPYWLINAGGKYDLTIKWWSHDRYQQVVDHFAGRIEFVQIGEDRHNHKPLMGAVDLRGVTDIRQLVTLVYHAQGVVSPVSFLMHLAAAVPTKPGAPSTRPCVVVLGGREPAHWIQYPQHQVLHTNGALPCCANGGCWRARTVPLGDQSDADKPNRLCVDVAPGPLPRCMDMISAEDVIQRIELYFKGGAISYLGGGQ